MQTSKKRTTYEAQHTSQYTEANEFARQSGYDELDGNPYEPYTDVACQLATSSGGSAIPWRNTFMTAPTAGYSRREQACRVNAHVLPDSRTCPAQNP